MNTVSYTETSWRMHGTVIVRNDDLTDCKISWTLFRNIRYMEGKIRAGASAQITVTNADGSFLELTDKDEVEAAIIKSNERKYHQTEGGSQLLEPFLTQDIGTCGDGPKVNEILDGTYLPPPSSTDATIAFLAACKRPENFIDATRNQLQRDTGIK